MLQTSDARGAKMNSPALQSSALEKLSATMLASLNTASTTWSNLGGIRPLDMAHLQTLSLLSQNVGGAAPQQLNSISQLNSLYLGNLATESLASASSRHTTVSSLLDTFAELSRSLNIDALSLKASDTNLPLNTVLPLSALRAELPVFAGLATAERVATAPVHSALHGAAAAQESQMIHEGAVAILAQAPNQSTARQEVRPQELHSTHQPQEQEQELQEEKPSEKPKKQRSSKLLSTLRQLLRALQGYFQEK